MRTVFKLDGVAYTGVHVVSLKRKFSVLDKDTAKRVLSGDMVRSIIGTYYNYSIEIDASQLSRAEYDTLYETISAPKNSHVLVVPYGQTTIQFNAYVSQGEDELLALNDNGSNDWSNLSFNFIAMSPRRRYGS